MRRNLFWSLINRFSLMPRMILLAARASLLSLMTFCVVLGPVAAEQSILRLFPKPPSDKSIFVPMQAEMDRSMKRLKLDSFGPPYFLMYRLVDLETLSMSFGYGAMQDIDRDISRTVYVETRYGSPSFDNTDLQYHGWSGAGVVDPQVLRHHFWALTDSAYKNAIIGYLDKKAKRATELDRDNLADFTREKSQTASLPEKELKVDLEAIRRKLEDISGEFKNHSVIYDSDVFLYVRRARKYLLTSEGSRIAVPYYNMPVLLFFNALTRAKDGMLLENRRAWAFSSVQDILPQPALRRAVGDLAQELKVMQEAPVQPPLSAPAIMDPEFTGVFFHEALGHKLEGERQRDPNESQIFRDRVGSQILPDFLSVIDDPTMTEFQGQPLNGHYRFDDEGVPASAVTLVDHGVLKGFLMSRWPIKGFDRSNGHGRSDRYHHPSGRMANLMVVAHRTLPIAELKKRLIEMCQKEGKSYGFWLRGSSGGENPTNRRSTQTLEVRPRLVYRVDARTGEETMVRGVKMVATPLVVLNRIVAAGDDRTLANPFTCGAESGNVPVNQIAPSVLVSEVELQRLPEDRLRPPILPSPFHDAP